MTIYWTLWGAAGIVFSLGGAASLRRRARHDPRGAGMVLSLAPLVAAVLALVGARLHALMEAPREVWQALGDGTFFLLSASAGQRIAGGLLLATAFLLLTVPWASGGRLRGLEILDTIVPWAGLSIFVGRFGCFLAGCCFGVPTDLPWGIRYPHESVAFWNHVAQARLPDTVGPSLAVHPLSLYLGLAAAGSAVTARVVSQLTSGRGLPTAAFIIVMAASRLLLEPLRETAFLPHVPAQAAIDTVLLVVALGGVVYSRISNAGGPSRPGIPMRWMRRAVSPSPSSYRGRPPSSRHTR